MFHVIKHMIKIYCSKIGVSSWEERSKKYMFNLTMLPTQSIRFLMQKHCWCFYNGIADTQYQHPFANNFSALTELSEPASICL